VPLNFDPRTRAELRDEEQVCFDCPLPECDEDDPACPYWLAYNGSNVRDIEALGVRIRRNTMRQAIRLALTMEVT
jgi:hypothetical protein